MIGSSRISKLQTILTLACFLMSLLISTQVKHYASNDDQEMMTLCTEKEGTIWSVIAPKDPKSRDGKIKFVVNNGHYTYEKNNLTILEVNKELRILRKIGKFFIGSHKDIADHCITKYFYLESHELIPITYADMNVMCHYGCLLNYVGDDSDFDINNSVDDVERIGFETNFNTAEQYKVYNNFINTVNLIKTQDTGFEVSKECENLVYQEIDDRLCFTNISNKIRNNNDYFSKPSKEPWTAFSQKIGEHCMNGNLPTKFIVSINKNPSGIVMPELKCGELKINEEFFEDAKNTLASIKQSAGNVDFEGYQNCADNLLIMRDIKTYGLSEIAKMCEYGYLTKIDNAETLEATASFTVDDDLIVIRENVCDAKSDLIAKYKRINERLNKAIGDISKCEEIGNKSLLSTGAKVAIIVIITIIMLLIIAGAGYLIFRYNK